MTASEEIDLLLTPHVEVVRSLLPEIEQRVLTAEQARSRIDDNPALVPIAVAADHESSDPADTRVYWADLSRHQGQQWQQVYAIDDAVRNGQVGEWFATGLDVLDHPPAGTVLAPTGFIFHMSRCGSTAVSRALARSERHLVHSQPAVLRDGIWSTLTAHWSEPPPPTAANLRLFRNLLAFLLRPRSSMIEAGFVKFFSENVLFLDFVRAAFPDTPSLFLFRDPVEVMASVAARSTGMLAARNTPRAQLVAGVSPDEDGAIDDWTFLTRCFGRYLDTVLASPTEGLTVLDYQDVRAEHFEAILADAFDYQLPGDDRDAVLDQFNLYSKADPSAPVTFEPDGERKRAAVPADRRHVVEAELGPAIDELRRMAWRPDPSKTPSR